MKIVKRSTTLEAKVFQGLGTSEHVCEITDSTGVSWCEIRGGADYTEQRIKIGDFIVAEGGWPVVYTPEEFADTFIVIESDPPNVKNQVADG